uniref:histone acetyltransferase n=1 Tax=Syphacia muris TaxID=451379 RepID=A0A158R5M2_9BILA
MLEEGVMHMKLVFNQMPALPRMVGNSEGEHSNSDSANESETMDVLVDENSLRFLIIEDAAEISPVRFSALIFPGNHERNFEIMKEIVSMIIAVIARSENRTWVAGEGSSRCYQSLLETPKLTPQFRSERRPNCSIASPTSVTSHNVAKFDSNISAQPSVVNQRDKLRSCRSSLEQYRMRGTHFSLRSGSVSLRKHESAATLVRKARSRRRLRINQIISTALKSASGRSRLNFFRPGRKPRCNSSSIDAIPILTPEKPINNNNGIEQDRPKEFLSPTRALLKNKLANGELTDLTDLDRNLFDAARQKVREDLASQCHSCVADTSSESGANPVRNPRFIRIGQFEIETWYSSPYPEEYARLDTLFLCEFCLKYMKSEMTEQRHYRKCEYRTPPGDEIYRNDKISVDGNTSRIYCQNVCLLAKLFLDHKTLYYDVEPFLFYVVTKSDDTGCHFVGYFSKEKYSAQRYNLSCIMTLPAYQRQGFGRFLIDFSFLLTRRENMLGTPERPLSDLGQISYRSYWQSAICEYIHEALTFNQHRKVTVKSIARGTGISPSDVVETLAQLEMLEHIDSQELLVINWSLIENHWKKAMSDKGRIWIDETKLTWSPKVYTPSKDYGVRSPKSPKSPLRSGEYPTVLSMRNGVEHGQRLEENFDRKIKLGPRRKLFPSIEQKIRRNARKGRQPASNLKQTVLRPLSSVNYSDCVRHSTDEKFQKKLFSSTRNTCKSGTHQKLQIRPKSSDDDSPGGRKCHTRGRGRKSLRRGGKKRMLDVKEEPSPILSNDETKNKSSLNVSTPKLESSFESGSSEDIEEPLSKQLAKNNTSKRISRMNLTTDIPKKGNRFASREKKVASAQQHVLKRSPFSDGELSSSSSSSRSESSSDSDSENNIRRRGNNSKVKNGKTVDLAKKTERKRRKTVTKGSYRRRCSLSSSSTSLSSYNSNSESSERLKTIDCGNRLLEHSTCMKSKF